MTTPDLIPASQPNPAVRLYRWFTADHYRLLGLVMLTLGSSLWVAAFLTWNT